MSPLVSILIPAFNSERWIGDTIESALAQTWPNREVIVVDDGSTDRTAAVAERFASRGVKVVKQANQGAATARNHAYSLCRGDYIQWLDADDLLAPDKITRQMEVALRTPDPRVLFSAEWGEFIHRPAKAVFQPSALWSDLAPIEWVLAKFEQNLYMANSTWLVRRELSEAVGPWDASLSLDDDGEYFSRLVTASRGIRFIPGARVYYRRASSGSLSEVGRSSGKLESQFRALTAQIGHVRALEDSPRVRQACVTLLQRWSIYFYPDRLDLFAQAQRLASELGGALEVPRLPWKYVWLQKFFGWAVAKRSQMYYNRLKWSVVRSWDKALFWLAKCNVTRNSAAEA